MNTSESNQKDSKNTQNPDFLPTPESKKLDVKTCRFAVISCTVAIFALLACVIAPFPESLPMILPIITFASGILAFIFGILSLRIIGEGKGILTGKGFAALGIAVPLGLLLFAVFIPGLRMVRSTISPRMYCGMNLSSIGIAMLIYTNDYDDQFPRAAGPNSKWGPTPNWQAVARAEAYGLTDGPGQATISANFYLLVKYTEVTPKSFLCKNDRKTTEFTLAKYKVRDKDIIDLWDFGPDPSKHCSYSYHIPYGPYPLTLSSDPGMAVAADRNPWLPSPGAEPREFDLFDLAGGKKAVQAGNTITHKKEGGQVVLYVDGHVAFEKESFCGVNDDNIYTVQSGTDIRRGIPPTLDSQPADCNDSLLVHDPPRETGK